MATLIPELVRQTPLGAPMAPPLPHKGHQTHCSLREKRGSTGLCPYRYWEPGSPQHPDWGHLPGGLSFLDGQEFRWPDSASGALPLTQGDRKCSGDQFITTHGQHRGRMVVSAG